MKPGDLWDELKRRRVVRAAVAYAAAAFVALQVAELTFEPLGLPAWTYRLLVIASLAAFPVVVALAWAFDVTGTGLERADAGGARGPGLKWLGIGAVVAGLAGTGWWLTARSSTESPAAVTSDVVAVVPFRVSSGDESLARMLREGVVDLLASSFSGSPRMVDPGAMIAAWRGFVASEDQDLSDAEGVRLAQSMGAGRVLLGSIVGPSDGFTASARLLSVPTGDVIGTPVTVEGSAGALGSFSSRLAGQILALEAGEEPARAEYLAGVPNQALQSYLEGRRLYRRASYLEARRAYTAALRADSTFVLAAVGLWEATGMGLDSPRFDERDYAERLIRDGLELLPPRDREYMSAFVVDRGPRNALEVIRDMEALVRAFPDKAEARYELGDRLFHLATLIDLPDALRRADTAFREALALDPDLQVVRQHLLWGASLYEPDTAFFQAELPAFLAAAEGSETESGARSLSWLVFGDPDDAVWTRNRLRSGTFEEGLQIAGWLLNALSRFTEPDIEAALDALERTAVTETQRHDAAHARFGLLRNTGRNERAGVELGRLEAIELIWPSFLIQDAIYWGGSDEQRLRAERGITARLAASSGDVSWDDGGRDLCALEVSRIRHGELDAVEATIARMEEASVDPDPSHGHEALCALLLRTLAADAGGDPSAESLVASLAAVMATGPRYTPATMANLELARLLEARGDFLGARDAVYSYDAGLPIPDFYSTMVRESARLADLGGDTAWALQNYRHYLLLFQGADPEFDEQLGRIRARVAELEAPGGAAR